jgi:hypothetical protein
MQPCTRLAHSRSACCISYRDALRLPPDTAEMSKHSMVSAQIDITTITAVAAQEGSLSLAAMLVSACAW